MAPIDSSNYYLAASAPSTSVRQLCSLVSHDDKQIRRKVADNPRLPPPCLAELAGDESPEVRISVAENSATPLPILELLADDPHPDVRYAMAENANTPTHILWILVHDDNPYVVARACQTLTRLADNPINLLRCCA